MAGKPGMTSTKPTTPPDRFEPGFLTNADMRCALPKLLYQRLGELYSDLGGEDRLSYQERALCERVIHLQWQIGEWETLARDNKPIPHGSYIAGINCLLGLLHALGLKRRAKDVPDLRDYLRRNGEAEDE